MVNGFNAEIVFEGTLFHIQTETGKEFHIETAVYAKGPVFLSAKTLNPGFTHASAGGAQEFGNLLEEQHRQVIKRIGAGEIIPPRAPVSGLGSLVE